MASIPSVTTRDQDIEKENIGKFYNYLNNYRSHTKCRTLYIQLKI